MKLLKYVGPFEKLWIPKLLLNQPLLILSNHKLERLWFGHRTLKEVDIILHDFLNFENTY